MDRKSENKNSFSALSMTSLFLQQSLQDSKSDWNRMIASPGSVPGWDAVILTASNEQQAEGYRKQLEYRRASGRFPAGVDIIIVPDRDGQRVGSAGSTLSVLRELKQKYGSFAGKRFLCIHAGGDARRTPQYSALGKLFSPVPCLIDGKPAALFDMFMLTMASVPGRLKEGMLLLSGDVILLFNPLMCDFGSGDAAVISFKEPAETGKDHGVYVRSENGNVRKFLHKQAVDTLVKEGAVDERGNCSIDTGAIAFSPLLMDRLYGLVDTEEKYDALVNSRVRLSLYGDIAYCLAEDSTLEQFYRETPEGGFCEELTAARTQLWNALNGTVMKLLSVSPSKFVHFGSIPEIMKLMEDGWKDYQPLGWSNRINSSIRAGAAAGYNAVLSERAVIGTGCYLEAAYVHGGAVVGDNVCLSFIDIHDEVIPSDVLLHGLKLSNGKFVCRIMGIRDNPKKAMLFGRSFEEIRSSLARMRAAAQENASASLLSRIGIPADAFSRAETLWTAELYPECDTVREAVASALALYDIIVNGTASAAESLLPGESAVLTSLCSGYSAADPQAIIDWNSRMEELVRMETFSAAVREGRPAREAAGILASDHLTGIQQEWLQRELHSLDVSLLPDFSYAMRLHYYLGAALSDERHTADCFRLISDAVLKTALAHLQFNKTCRITQPETVVRLPLRVNWGGGWTDTCPHCLERGGTVLNAAITLNGEYPVEVRLVRIPEKKIVFDSRDMDVHGEFTELAPLQQTGDPYDPFALQKACLLACGVIPVPGVSAVSGSPAVSGVPETLSELLGRLGGGFEMHSEVTNVPKGSGLGTSSILSAAAVKAVLTFLGIPFTDEILYATVLAMEQIMSTGGGWQDQVGGMTPGIKFITSEPGLEQKLRVEQVRISAATKEALSGRFAVIYTGQRRLARNLLRDVVGRYVGNEPDSLYAHREIQKTAALMRFSLERGDVDEFAALLDRHWELSKMIDAGSSNTLIEQIFLSIEDLIDARMVCGAGGGGFLQVMLKKGVTAEEVHCRLKDVFQDFAVDIWPCELV